MTTDQLAAIHTMRRRLEKLNPLVCDRAWYDLVLRNLGQIKPGLPISSKHLTNAGFERVMAMLEENLAKFDSQTGTYWRDRERRRGHYLTTRQEWHIRTLFGQLQAKGSEYQLAGLIRRMTRDRAERVEDLSPGEADKVIRMMSAALVRARLVPSEQPPRTTEALH
jgi:hypothetical protein